jgi:hypothetical protein
MKFLSRSFYGLALAAGLTWLAPTPVHAQDQPVVNEPLGTARPTQKKKKSKRQPKSRNVAHSTLPFTIGGEFTLDPEKTTDLYKGVPADRFGSTQVMLPDGDPNSPTYGQLVVANTVRDLHYALERDSRGVAKKVGLHPIPVSEPHFDLAPGAEIDASKPGSHLMDRHLRKVMNLGPNDPIFATIAYLHPENHSGDIKQLATEALKTEQGQTHLGMYLGGGFTRNSPETYHSKGWKIGGYPATVQIISMQGTDQATLNQNGHIAAGILNDDVQFPSDYKNDVYQTVTLGRTLAFYRGWLEDDAKLKSDDAWKTYCAEHATIVINIMLNVPHNQASFTEIWGTDGAALFALAKQKYKTSTGKELVETSFEPLWKKDGITNPAAFGASDVVDTKDIGPGLAWPPQHNADLVRNFLEVYASWPNVGAPASAAALFGFKETIVKRMLNTEQDPAAVKAEAEALSTSFNAIAIPTIAKMFVYEAMTKKPEELPAHFKRSAGVLYVAIGGKVADLAPGATPDPARMGLVKVIMASVEQNRAKIVARSIKGTSVAQAYYWFKRSIDADLRRARKIDVSNPDKVVRYNSPPAVTHRVASRLHPINKHVKIEEVATAFDAKELITKAALAEREKAAAEAAAAAAAGGNQTGLSDHVDSSTTDGND